MTSVTVRRFATRPPRVAGAEYRSPIEVPQPERCVVNDSAAVRRIKEVCDRLPGDALAAVIAIIYDIDPTLTQTAIGAAIGKDAGTVRRAMKRLADVDLIDRRTRTDARAIQRCAAVDVRASLRVSAEEPRADSRGSSRARVPLSQEELLTETDAPTAVDAATKSEAVALARRVFDAKRPKPVSKFVAVVTMARRFLDAGHDAAAVEAAMVAVPTITVGWVESELNRQPPKPLQRPDPPRPTQPKPVERCDRCGCLTFDCTCDG